MKTHVVHVGHEPYDIYIGRRMNRLGLPQSRWANPFRIDAKNNSREDVIAEYRTYLERSPELLAALPELQGKVLGCWCAPNLCHGDVLAELADAAPPAPRPEGEVLGG